MIEWLADWLLAYLQRRCEHPDAMVAVDVLEGCVPDLKVKVCRRCGAIKTEWTPTSYSPFTTLDHYWRRPDPFLWRGR